MIDEEAIGKRIKQVREDKGMTQNLLSEKTGIGSTQLSGYENGKIPGLSSLAKIAHALEVTIDMLYYGDASESFISSAPSKGHVIANSINALHSYGMISSPTKTGNKIRDYWSDNERIEYAIPLNRYEKQMIRLIDRLEDCRKNSDTFDNIESYIKQIKDSVAKDIDSGGEEHFLC